jgi:hypothetical protein
MEALLDGQPVEISIADGQKLEALLAEVNQIVAGRGRAVVSIQCDGQEVNAEALTAALGKPLSEFQRVELTSAPAKEVADAVLNQAGALVAETERDHGDIVELLNEGNTVRGMELLGGSFRLWQQAHDAVLQAVRLGGIRLDEVEVDGVSSMEIINGLKDKLAQIKDALEARDYVMLADILQYELGDTVQSWIALIGRMRERLADES